MNTNNEDEKNLGGRPRFGRTLRQQMNIAIDDDLRRLVQDESRRNGVSVSVTVCEAIEHFLMARERTRALLGISNEVIEEKEKGHDPRVAGGRRWEVNKL